MFNYLLWKWKCSCAKWWSSCAMQCIHFEICILQPACSFTCALSALSGVNSLLAGAELWGKERELHLPHPQPLTHASLSWHPQHTFSQNSAADYFWVPVHFKGRQRGSWDTQRVCVLSPTLAPLLGAHPPCGGDIMTCPSSSWHVGDTCSSIRSDF